MSGGTGDTSRDAAPLVSVITATYNSEETLCRTIESVLNQTYANIEYIIADGASNDRTLEIAESYKSKFAKKGYQYKILSSRDNGIYSGINKGIEQARGIIVGNVNSDDYYEPEMVETAIRTYQEEKYDLFYANLNIVDDNGIIVKVKKSEKMRGIITTRHWNHPTMFVPNRIYQKRKYNENFRYYADCDLMLWLYRHSEKIFVVNKELSNFRLGGRSTQKNMKESIKKMKERYIAYRHNHYSWLYIFECIFMDIGKDMVVRIVNKK